jgi:hypothetical protein
MIKMIADFIPFTSTFFEEIGMDTRVGTAYYSNSPEQSS